MSPFAAGLLGSIVTNGLSTIVTYVVHLSQKQSRQQTDLRDAVARDPSLVAILQRATTSFARQAEGFSSGIADSLRLFIVSPDVDSIVRQIYATKLADEHPSEHPSQIRNKLKQDFQASFALYLPEPAQDLADFADVLFQTLLEACDRALDVAIDKGFLSAHETKSAARANLILGELSAIRTKLKFLGKAASTNPKAVDAFEEKLRSQIAARHGFIVPPHFASRQRIPIDDLYVVPTLTSMHRPSDRQEKSHEISLDNFRSFLFRAVILGNPGSGKSTLASKLCHTLCEQYMEKPLGGRRVTPLIVVLRDFGSVKNKRRVSILQFMEEQINTNYQIAPLDSAMEYLLQAGRLCVIFDGLDELLDTSYRQKVSEDVESFATLYPSVPILVTSREVGYEQAPLDHHAFELFRIAPFEESQTEEYVNKWFSVDEELPPDQRKTKAAAFLEESRTVPDLRSNPLMLALLCNIYRGENYIPRNRPDVYEKCALMLFEKWDKSRGIYVPLPFEAHVKPAMMHLAHWIYSNGALQGGATETALVDESTRYLCPLRYEDPDEARQAATSFIQFCSGRAWVFTDTGTTKFGERLYQFTHRTFLEYFTAAYVVRTHPLPDKLIRSLSSRIAAREWDVVAQLSCQIQNRQTEGACDAQLSKLLHFAKSGRRGTQSKGNLLSFACRSLQFLIPTPEVARHVVSSGIEFCLQVGEERYAGDQRGSTKLAYHQPGPAEEILYGILSVADENRSPVALELAAQLEAHLNSEREARGLITLQLLSNLSSCLRIPWYEQESSEALIELWSSLSNRVLSAHKKKVTTLCQSDGLTCISAFFADVVHIDDVIDWHGIRSMFLSGNLGMPPHCGYGPMLPYILLHVLDMTKAKSTKGREQKEKWLLCFDRVAERLLSAVPPFVTRAHAEKHLWNWNMRHGAFYPRRRITPRRLAAQPHSLRFLLAVAAAIEFELSKDPREFLFAVTKGVGATTYRHFLETLRVRAQLVPQQRAEKELAQQGLVAAERDLMRSWSINDVSFIEG